MTLQTTETTGWGTPKAELPEAVAQRIKAKTEPAEKETYAAGSKGESAADIMVKLASKRCRLWIDAEEKAFASWTVGEGEEAHEENAPLRSRPFRRMLGGMLFAQTGKGATSRNFEAAEATLEAMADSDKVIRQTAVRVSANDKQISLDLGGAEWKGVQVTHEGIRLIKGTDAPVKFLRRQGMQALPTPDLTATPESLKLLWQFVNVRERDRVLVLGWLLQCLQPAAPYFGLNLFGGAGAAKTSSTRTIRRLIDPNRADTASFPSDAKDLFISGQSQHILAFDNLSFLTSEQSDWLCMISTGSGYRTRTLFTDSDETILTSRSPWLINGIPNVVARGDLLERALSVELLPISEKDRREEQELDSDFHHAAPKILGALLNATRQALNDRTSTRQALRGKLPRMADAVTWICAGETALGFPTGTFLAEHARMLQTSRHDALDGEPIAKAIIARLEFHELHAEKTNQSSIWEAPLGEILKEVQNHLDWTDKGRKGDSLGTPRAFSSYITRMAPIIRGSAGIAIDRVEPRKSDGYHYTISRAQI